MGNQQGKISDLNWLAGLVDGEGCLDFGYSNTKKKKYRYPRFRISMVDMIAFEEVQRILESINIGYHVEWRRRDLNVHPKWTDAWVITTSGFKRMKKYLTIITSYLRLKKWQANRILEFIDLRENHIVGDDYTERESQIIKSLNDYTPSSKEKV